MRIFPLGENALTVEFGGEISEELNRLTLNLAEYLTEHSFPGFIETVPAYASTTIFYDTIAVRQAFPEFHTAFDLVKTIVEAALPIIEGNIQNEGRIIEIPMNFDPEFALDLPEIAKISRLTAEEVIDVFLSRVYRVYMLGFLPGFAYMGTVDDRIAVPRKETPRMMVPKGSVGIAGRQTGIYPLESPGGWQIIGKTDIELFAPNDEMPCLLAPGDSVKFVTVRR